MARLRKGIFKTEKNEGVEIQITVSEFHGLLTDDHGYATIVLGNEQSKMIMMHQTLKITFIVCCMMLYQTADGQSSRTPNIVIIYADDMGYGDLGIQNPESKIPTPNLDQLAREGLRFTDGHSSSGICTPSRFALLTGQYHWRRMHGIVNSFDPPVFKPEDLTMAEMLQEKGYATACIGKWHLGWDWPIVNGPGEEVRDKKGRVRQVYTATDIDWSQPIQGGPLDQGFEYYYGDDVPNFPPYAWIENEHVVEVPTHPLTETPATAEGRWEARPGPMVDGWQLDAVMPAITRKAVEWIDQQKGNDKPFFLYFPMTSPHAPIVPAKEFQGKSRAGGYGDFMVQTDWSAGQILEALERNGFGENTVVIFSSDNGPEHYAYDRIRNFVHYSMGELRGLKRDLWEGGHRVPFIIRWPGVIKPGRVSDETVSQVDLMATIATILDYPLPRVAGVDSYNLLPLLKGEDYNTPLREATVQNTFSDGYAIRKGDWLLITAPTGGVTKVPDWFNELRGYPQNSLPGELYHLGQDISQKHNLYHEHPEIVKELKELLTQYQQEGRSIASHLR